MEAIETIDEDWEKRKWNALLKWFSRVNHTVWFTLLNADSVTHFWTVRKSSWTLRMQFISLGHREKPLRIECRGAHSDCINHAARIVATQTVQGLTSFEGDRRCVSWEIYHTKIRQNFSMKLEVSTETFNLLTDNRRGNNLKRRSHFWPKKNRRTYFEGSRVGLTMLWKRSIKGRYCTYCTS